MEFEAQRGATGFKATRPHPGGYPSAIQGVHQKINGEAGGGRMGQEWAQVVWWRKTHASLLPLSVLRISFIIPAWIDANQREEIPQRNVITEGQK